MQNTPPPLGKRLIRLWQSLVYCIAKARTVWQSGRLDSVWRLAEAHGVQGCPSLLNYTDFLKISLKEFEGEFILNLNLGMW